MKALMPDDAKEASGHGVRALKRGRPSMAVATTAW
jgi:hypothetical protein